MTEGKKKWQTKRSAIILNAAWWVLLTHNASPSAFQELHNDTHLGVIGHLRLNLIDYIMHARLTVEQQTIGVGDMLLHFL